MPPLKQTLAPATIKQYRCRLRSAIAAGHAQQAEWLTKRLGPHAENLGLRRPKGGPLKPVTIKNYSQQLCSSRIALELIEGGHMEQYRESWLTPEYESGLRQDIARLEARLAAQENE